MMTKYSGLTIALEKKFSGIMAKQGLRITEFPAEERKRWAHKLPNLPKQWAETWDKRGSTGQQGGWRHISMPCGRVAKPLSGTGTRNSRPRHRP